MAQELNYDFTELPNGSFPEGFGLGILKSEAGVDSVVEETAPTLYFSVVDGKGSFNYIEQVVGGATNRRGFASIPGFLEGRDFQASVQFVNPLLGHSQALDEVWVQIGLGVRGKNNGKEWVGGLIETHWIKGTGWVPKWKMSVVEVNGTISTFLETLEKDIHYNEINEMVVRAEDAQVEVSFNGLETITAESTFRGEDVVALWIRATSNNGVGVAPIPILTSMVGQSLNLHEQYPIKEIHGNFVEPPFDGAHFYNIPIQELVNDGSLKQLTPNTWEFTREVIIDRPQEYIQFSASLGSKIIAHRQTLKDAHVQTCKFLYGR